MYKIFQQKDRNGVPTNKYTLECYLFDEDSHSNTKFAVFDNLSELDMAQVMQTYANVQDDELDFSFITLKSGNGPVILAVDGPHVDLLPVPVKMRAEEKNSAGPRVSEGDKKSLFQRKKRGDVPS